MLNPGLAQARAPVRAAAYLDLAQMVTGAALIVFMWSHMVLVVSVNLGAGVMNAIARFLEVTYMAQLGMLRRKMGWNAIKQFADIFQRFKKTG
jgi:succinate dehydrogenase/fumarate reductase cytochrome b subunit